MRPLVFCIITAWLCLLVARPLIAQTSLPSLTAADCSYGGNLKSIAALDRLTVQFTLCTPDPAFLAKVAFSAFSIHSADQLIDTGGGGDALLRNPIGTGPFQLAEWIPGEVIVLNRNPLYWGELPIESSVTLRWNADPAARLAALQARQIDGIDNPAPSAFAVLEANSRFVLYPRLPQNIFYLGINNTIPPFDNPNVRLALAYGISKQEIVNAFYPPGSTIATQFMPPSIFGYTPNARYISYNPERARQLLEESGVALPIAATLTLRDVVRGYLPQPVQVAENIAAQLAEIGFDLTIEGMESSVFLDASNDGLLSLHLLGWSADYPDATNFLDFHFGIGASAQFGEKNSELMALLSQAAQLSDPVARLEWYEQANTILADWMPMVPIAHGGSAVAFKSSIAGAYAGSFGAEQYRVMEDSDDDDISFMQSAEPISLYCNDETDGETLRVCEQIHESLYSYELGGGIPVPALAVASQSNTDLTLWTFTLRDGVRFSDGSEFDAEDVVVSWIAMWDAASPLHKGRTGSFEYFSALFGGFLNAP